MIERFGLQVTADASPSLTKYRQAFLVGLQSNLVYRWNFAVAGCLLALPARRGLHPLGRGLRRRAAMIGGFDFGQTLTYFIVLIVLQFFVGAFNEDYQISEEIRNGLINQFLLKPINYYLYRFSIFAGGPAGFRAPSSSCRWLLAAALPPRLARPARAGAWRFALALPAMALAALIQFTIAYCFGLLTFWFLEIQGFVILSMAVESILGGQMFPLDLLPPALFRAAQFLPFYYQMYFPAAILTGRIGGSAAVRGLGIQAAWALVLLAGARSSGAAGCAATPRSEADAMNYLRIWLAGARYSLVRTMMFRGDFFIWSLVEFFWMAVNVLLDRRHLRAHLVASPAGTSTR